MSSTPNLTTLRKLCEGAKAGGARTIILAFDEFWTQYRKGQGGKPRQLLPDTDAYIQRLAKISQTLKSYGLGLELSLLSPLEIGRGYHEKTGESGRWVQYREGYRDPATGRFTVCLWEQRRWTNNKGSILLKRTGVRVFAFREQRLGGTDFYHVDPADIVELKSAPDIEADESAVPSTDARRLTIQGKGETHLGPLDRVLVVVSYATPEMDYFSPQARSFLQALIERYHAAGVPLNGLYSDEMHIQQDWGYASHHDEGEFTFRYLTPHLAARYAELYGSEFKDFDKYLVYFAYAQHGFLPTLEARAPAQHVLGSSPEDIQRTFLLRRRYYELLEETVVGLFAGAKQFAEKSLRPRAGGTRARHLGREPHLRFLAHRLTARRTPRKYEYTPDFWWSNTVHQAASACDDYFAWNDFLTGGGNDHAEGGWSDRNYYGIALACSTGILNRTPYAYAAAWGMPHLVAATPPGGLRRVRRGSVSVVPGGAGFAAPRHGRADALPALAGRLRGALRLVDGAIRLRQLRHAAQAAGAGHASVRMAGSKWPGARFGTLVVLFEPLPPPGLLDFLARFVESGGKVIWSGPPPRVDLSGQAVLAQWQKLFGVNALRFGLEGHDAAGWQVQFSGALGKVPPQDILTDFLVDRIYPVEPRCGDRNRGQGGPARRRRSSHGGTERERYLPRLPPARRPGRLAGHGSAHLVRDPARAGRLPRERARPVAERQPRCGLAHDSLCGMPFPERRDQRRLRTTAPTWKAGRAASIATRSRTKTFWRRTRCPPLPWRCATCG